MSNQKNGKKKGLKSGIVSFGVVFALLSWIFKFHSLPAFILAFVLSGLAGSVIKVMASGLDLSTKDKTPDSLKKVQGTTGNPDVDALLEKGRAMIVEIREENARIPDTGLTNKLNKLESQCAEIFRAVYDKPAKAPQIRKFMDYYLPTTLKMVKGYRVLGERNLAGQDVQAARKRIDDALGVVLTGCQKMLDNLYRDDVLDITTDIDVLEQMLKRDGLTEGELQKAAEQARQAARIDAEAAKAAQARQAAEAQAAQSKAQAEAQAKAQAQAQIQAAQAKAQAEAQARAQAEQQAQQARQLAEQQALARKQAQQEALKRDAEEQAQKLAAQKAAEEALAAKRAQAPTMYWQTDSGVKGEVVSAVQQSQTHMPQAPTLSGGMYPTYGGQAAAVAQKEQE